MHKKSSPRPCRKRAAERERDGERKREEEGNYSFLVGETEMLLEECFGSGRVRERTLELAVSAASLSLPPV